MAKLDLKAAREGWKSMKTDVSTPREYLAKLIEQDHEWHEKSGFHNSNLFFLLSYAALVLVSGAVVSSALPEPMIPKYITTALIALAASCFLFIKLMNLLTRANAHYWRADQCQFMLMDLYIAESPMPIDRLKEIADEYKALMILDSDRFEEIDHSFKENPAKAMRA